MSMPRLVLNLISSTVNDYSRKINLHYFKRFLRLFVFCTNLDQLRTLRDMRCYRGDNQLSKFGISNLSILGLKFECHPRVQSISR